MFLSRQYNRKQRKSTKAHKLMFERFEPRHLMTADGIVASYGSDFGSAGWSYSYNAVGQDLLSDGGDLTALTIASADILAPPRVRSQVTLQIDMQL